MQMKHFITRIYTKNILCIKIDNVVYIIQSICICDNYQQMLLIDIYIDILKCSDGVISKKYFSKYNIKSLITIFY